MNERYAGVSGTIILTTRLKVVRVESDRLKGGPTAYFVLECSPETGEIPVREGDTITLNMPFHVGQGPNAPTPSASIGDFLKSVNERAGIRKGRAKK